MRGRVGLWTGGLMGRWGGFVPRQPDNNVAVGVASEAACRPLRGWVGKGDGVFFFFAGFISAYRTWQSMRGEVEARRERIFEFFEYWYVFCPPSHCTHVFSDHLLMIRVGVV